MLGGQLVVVRCGTWLVKVDTLLLTSISVATTLAAPRIHLTLVIQYTESETKTNNQVCSHAEKFLICPTITCQTDAEQSVRMASALGMIGGYSAARPILRMATRSIGRFSFLIFLGWISQSARCCTPLSPPLPGCIYCLSLTCILHCRSL